MPVQAGGGHVGEFRPEVCGGQLPVAEEGADNPQPYRMEEQLCAFHLT
jgi:hypothetical protein